jgi:hypothetical protein
MCARATFKKCARAANRQVVVDITADGTKMGMQMFVSRGDTHHHPRDYGQDAGVI